MTSERQRKQRLNEMKDSLINVLRAYLMVVSVRGSDPTGLAVLKEKLAEMDEYEVTR